MYVKCSPCCEENDKRGHIVIGKIVFEGALIQYLNIIYQTEIHRKYTSKIDMLLFKSC